MPDTPKKPEVPPTSTRGRGRGRGTVARGRGASSSGSLPSGRLMSFRPTIAGNTRPTATPTSTGSIPSSSGSALVFKPKTQVQRHKKEPTSSSLLSTASAAPKREHKPHGFSDRGRGGRGRGRGRGGHVELIQTVSGPFAQGPAMISNSSRRGGSGFGGIMAPPGSSTNGGVDGPAPTSGMDEGDAKVDLSDPNAPVLLLTDHNEDNQKEDLDVQTEEMALKAAEEMRALKLDSSTASVFKSAIDGEEEKLLVLQLPAVPEFELPQAVVERRAKERMEARERRRLAKVAEAEEKAKKEEMAGNVKPNLAELEGTVDVDAAEETKKPEDGGDVDLTDDEEDAAVVDGLLDGRIGTLVVLKSGAVKMKIGELLLDVSMGADCQFFRGLMALDTKGANSAFVLGNIDEQLVCTPDLENMLK